MASSPDQIPSLVATVQPMLDDVLKAIHTEDIGVHVQVSKIIELLKCSVVSFLAIGLIYTFHENLEFNS